MILADQASSEDSIWQLVESCAYSADLAVWSELTAGSASILDLGCGIGRVARFLASEGRSVVGVDQEPAMIVDLNRLAAAEGVTAITGDVTELASLDLGRERFETIIAPQQLLHILGGKESRHRLLAGVKERLEPEGVVAFAISELIPQESQPVDVLPDMRELGEAVYASRPVAVEATDDALTIVRLRQVVRSDGSLEEFHDRITLDLIDRVSLGAELAAVGLAPERFIEIPETDRHISSVIVCAR